VKTLIAAAAAALSRASFASRVVGASRMARFKYFSASSMRLNAEAIAPARVGRQPSAIDPDPRDQVRFAVSDAGLTLEENQIAAADRAGAR